MNDKTLVSKDNLKSISYSVFQDLITKIKNKDISLPYTTKLAKSAYLKIDGLGNMFLNNNGQYIDLGNINKDKLDIDKIIDIFDIRYNLNEYWSIGNYRIPTPRGSYGYILYNGKIYVIGGTNGTITNKMEIYDIKSNTWSTGTSMPEIKCEFACSLYNDKIYCIGGYNGNAFLKSVYIYDIVNNTWSTGTFYPILCTGFKSIVYNDKIYCIGGYNGNGFLKSVYIYDIVNNTWSTANNMNTSRKYHEIIENNGKIYAIGGEVASNSISNTIESYDIFNNSWNILGNMVYNRKLFGAIVYNNKIYIIGGYNTVPINNMEIYDISTNTFTTGKNMIYTDAILGAELYNNIFYCLGYSTPELYHLPYKSYHINIPDSLYSKLNEIITNGDGTKIFHNNGKYKTIAPTYQIMNSDDINEIMNYCTSEV